MFDEFNNVGNEATPGLTNPARPVSSENTVDLFPALADRRMMPINAIRQAVPVKPGTQISIFAPVSFDEALDIVECLRARAATTVTLDNMRKVDASRLVDFVAGASAALQGNFHKLSEQVYVFCPSNIKISAPSALPSRSATATGLPSLDFLYPKDSSLTKTKLSSSWTSV